MSNQVPLNPLVSVTFPIHHYNSFAELALSSILNQTYSNIEILFLDNSRHGLFENFNLDDERIRYFKLPEEFGLSETLNFAIQNAEGDYLVRMDYDDLAIPSRIRLQVDFMEHNKNVSISGGSIRVIGKPIDHNVKPGEIVSRPQEHEEILHHLLSKNAFFHPTVIFRLADIRKEKMMYRKKFDSAEDLDFWIRASHRLNLANMPDVILEYRIHDNQYSRLDGLNSSSTAIWLQIQHTIWMILKRRIGLVFGTKIIVSKVYRYIPMRFKYWKNEKFKKFQSNQ